MLDREMYLRERRRCGLGAEGVSEITGISLDRINDIDSGDGVATDDEIALLARALDVNPHDIKEAE